MTITALPVLLVLVVLVSLSSLAAMEVRMAIVAVTFSIQVFFFLLALSAACGHSSQQLRRQGRHSSGYHDHIRALTSERSLGLARS
jgi:ABC-type transport system involved in cytochrome bd biosynthesis fused ATPase/permease subunit